VTSSSPPRLATLALSAGGLGFSRIAPGTLGSLPPVILAFALACVIGAHWTVTASVLLLGLAGAIACVRFAPIAERFSQRKDPQWIVADEVAGQSIALIALPWVAFADGGLARNAALAAGAFVAFRLFDITKPPPIRRLERLGGGWGILLDDLLAGVWALIVVQVGVWVLL